MIKKILIAALLWPLLALAQSYPSPTYQNLTVLGTFTSSGNVGLSSLAAQAANTVVANATASSASPTAFAMPSCSTSSSALNWTTSTGFTCNTSINAASLGGSAANTYAPLASPTLTGTPAAPTATAGTNTTQIATTAFVANSFAPLASPALTGTPTAPTASAGTSTTQLATTAFVTSNSLPTGWTSYSPTVSAASGTYTTASAVGSYTKIGKLVCISVAATITTVGTGTQTILSLPFSSATGGSVQILPGRETASTGNMLQGDINPSSSTMTIFTYSNSSAAANGAVETISGCYLGA